MKKIIASLLVGAQFVFLGVGFVQADGMVVKPSPFSNNPGRSTFDFVRETDQQAFINYVDGEEKMIISVGLDKNESKEAFWIFPVPANPDTVKINILKEIPDLKGEEVRQEAKVNLNSVKFFLNLTQIYPFFQFIFPFQTINSLSAPRGAGNTGAMSSNLSDQIKSKPDVEVFEHIEKEGLISEVITAQTLNGLKEYLEKKNINIDADSLPILGDYLGKNFSFVVSWMDIDELITQGAIQPEELTTVMKEENINAENLDIFTLYKSLQSNDKRADFNDIIYNFENENPKLKEAQRIADVVEKLAEVGNIFPESDMIKDFPRIRKIVVDLENKYPELKINPAGMKNDEFFYRINRYIKPDILGEIVDEITKDPANINEIWKIADPMIKNHSLSNHSFNPNSELDNLIIKKFLEKNLYNRDLLSKKLADKFLIKRPEPVVKTQQRNFPKEILSSVKSSQKGIFVSFPTDKIYFPLYPTSVYGENKIPVEIRVMGIKKPKIYQNIKNATKVQYFINNNTSYTVENKDFFGSNPPSRYTKIKIDTQPKFFTEDLWISNYPPVSILPIIVMAEHSILLFIALLVVVSILAGAMTTVIFRQRIALSGERKITYIKYSLLNCFSIVALLVGLLVWKKKVSLDDRPLQEIEDENKAFDKLRKNGYSEWTIRFLKSRRTKKMGGWLFSFVFSLCFLFLAWAVTLLLKLLVSE